MAFQNQQYRDIQELHCFCIPFALLHSLPGMPDTMCVLNTQKPRA